MPTPSASRVARPVALALGLCAALVAACADFKERKPVPGETAEQSITIEQSTEAWPQFPCTQCHKHRAGPPDPNERVLAKYHSAKKIEHGHFQGWCYRCHSDENPNMLHLVDGTQLPFEESYELCSGCHGDKGQDWRRGVHGLTVGFWNGPRTRRACTLCHDPHKPRFAPMVPEKPPQRPRTMPDGNGRVTAYE